MVQYSVVGSTIWEQFAEGQHQKARNIYIYI